MIRLHFFAQTIQVVPTERANKTTIRDGARKEWSKINTQQRHETEGTLYLAVAIVQGRPDLNRQSCSAVCALRLTEIPSRRHHPGHAKGLAAFGTQHAQPPLEDVISSNLRSK